MATNPVIIEFLAKGVPDLTRAFRTVIDAATAAERAQTSRMRDGSTQRARLTEREARDRVRTWQKSDKEITRIHDRAARDAAKAMQDETRATERAAREKVRIMERVDREAARIRERAVRDTARAEEAKNRESMRWVRQREHEQARSRDRFGRALGGGVMSGVARPVATSAPP